MWGTRPEGQGGGRARRVARRLAVACAACAVAATAQGQGGGYRGPGINDLALDWVRGNYISPVVCVLEGEPFRGKRRLLIGPGPRDTRPAVGKLSFVDLKAEDASRCFSELVSSEPNIVGTVEFRLEDTRRRDTAMHDFKQVMRRQHGFDFVITRGQLRLQEIGSDAEPENRVLSRGRLSFQDVQRGSDAAKVLSDFRGARKVLLELEGPDGRALRFPLVQESLD